MYDSLDVGSAGARARAHRADRRSCRDAFTTAGAARPPRRPLFSCVYCRESHDRAQRLIPRTVFGGQCPLKTKEKSTCVTKRPLVAKVDEFFPPAPNNIEHTTHPLYVYKIKYWIRSFLFYVDICIDLILTDDPETLGFYEITPVIKWQITMIMNHNDHMARFD